LKLDCKILFFFRFRFHFSFLFSFTNRNRKTKNKSIRKASKIRDIIYSDEFSVYPAKKFPGMTQSSQLSLWFSKQGLRIPVRREARAKKPKLDE